MPQALPFITTLFIIQPIAMDYFHNAAVLWFVLGFVLFVLEFLIPGLILFFFGVGAWIVAALSLFIPLPFNIQLIIFLASSLLTIVLFRKGVKKIMWSRSNTSEIEDEFLGKTGIAETFIGPGSDGKIDFKGTIWNARSADNIEKGDKVIITGNDSILLFVQSTKTSV